MMFISKKYLKHFMFLTFISIAPAFIIYETHSLNRTNYKDSFHTLYNPFDKIIWTAITDYGDVQDIGSLHYYDVISHTSPIDPECPRSLGMAFSQASVRVHETQHMLHYQIKKMSGYRDSTYEGLYYGQGLGIIMKNPRTKVTDFSYKIPYELQTEPSPYRTYIIDQMRYPSLNNIGYLFNEWGSYISNIRTNLELENIGFPELGDHAASYSPHFFGYVAIAIHHMKMYEPEILKDEQFKATFAIYAESTWELMHAALNSPVFGEENTIYGSRIKAIMRFYRDSAQFEDVRNTLKEIYGDSWVLSLMQ